MHNINGTTTHWNQWCGNTTHPQAHNCVVICEPQNKLQTRDILLRPARFATFFGFDVRTLLAQTL